MVGSYGTIWPQEKTIDTIQYYTKYRNDLYCVEWDVKLYSSQPTNLEKNLNFITLILARSVHNERLVWGRDHQETQSAGTVESRPSDFSNG